MQDIDSSTSLASSRSKRSRTRAIEPASGPAESIASAKHKITGAVGVYSPSRELTALLVHIPAR